MILLKSTKCPDEVKPDMLGLTGKARDLDSGDLHLHLAFILTVHSLNFVNGLGNLQLQAPYPSTSPLFSGDLLVGSAKSYRPLGKNVLTVSLFFSCYGMNIHPSLFLLTLYQSSAPTKPVSFGSSLHPLLPIPLGPQLVSLIRHFSVNLLNSYQA